MILTPRCPLCDQPPAIAEPWLATWFCGNEDCLSLCWDPTKNLDELLTNASQAKITGNWSPPEERT